MQLKRTTFYETKGNPRLQKALALALYLKGLVGRTSTIHNYCIYRLHLLSGVSPSTLKKYLPIMRQMGWVKFDGKHNQHLVIKKLASHTAGRNICVDEFDFESFKDTYNSLRAFMALAVQHRKEFIRRTIQTYRAPSNKEVFKKARKTLKRLVKMDVLEGMDIEYRETGLSYRRIAQETGNCIRTAQRIIKYATERDWCVRQRHAIIHRLKGICFRDVEGFFTYSTRDYVVLMQANTYKLSERITLSLGGGY